MAKWIGCAVSVNCGEPLGCYQGTILKADASTITLTKAFRNGFPYPKSLVTLNAADIKDLRIIEEAKCVLPEQSQSMVAATKTNKKSSRSTVCENLQATSSNTSSQPSNGTNKNSSSRGGPPARSKPIDIQPNKTRVNNYAGSLNTSVTPKGRGCCPGTERARRRNEACFGDAADSPIGDDFDFEGNLALFDKKAVSWEVRGGAGGTARPDVVADAAMRHDENVLPAAPAIRTLELPVPLQAPHHYTTDDGRELPAATPRARNLLWEGLQRHRLLEDAILLAARAAADLTLKLCGGGRRLEARNAHQAPVVVVAAGLHLGGAAGVATARLLLSHGVRAHVALSGIAPGIECGLLRRELCALRAAGGGAQPGTDGLPAPDVVVLALYDPLNDDGQEGHDDVLSWTRAQRSCVVALEPPGAGWAGTSARAVVLGGLPVPLDASLGRVFLANIAPPQQLFTELGVRYQPPFGAASLLPLH